MAGGGACFVAERVERACYGESAEVHGRILMHYRGKQIIVIALFLGLATVISVAQAETPFDFLYCGSQTNTMVSTNKEMTILAMDGKGIVISNHENKAFDNFTYHFVGIVRVMDGKRTGLGYTKYLDPDGDMIFQEFTMDGMESGVRLLQGTGKWKGITGTGKSIPLTRGKPITPDTAQSCRRITGTFELPK
jgi:hypothetical protein